jgi:hypothetical protein
MRYGFGIRYTCNETTCEVPPERELDVFFNEVIHFDIDREKGEVPDIAAAGPCATPLGSIGVEKEVKMMDGGAMCPVLKPGPQPTQACVLSVNETVADLVAVAMLQEASCPDQTWPNVTGLVGKCRPQSSGQEKQWRGAVLATSLIAAFTLALILLLL